MIIGEHKVLKIFSVLGGSLLPGSKGDKYFQKKRKDLSSDNVDAVQVSRQVLGVHPEQPPA